MHKLIQQSLKLYNFRQQIYDIRKQLFEALKQIYYHVIITKNNNYIFIPMPSENLNVVNIDILDLNDLYIDVIYITLIPDIDFEKNVPFHEILQIAKQQPTENKTKIALPELYKILVNSKQII